MPAVSKKQQKFFGIVRAIQKGEMAPTTPETAKAAADMKKGDVKKFASTKHKGLPEKKKIEEDRQVKKIIKQLRKSVKSHKKQADTLEKKIKTFKESAFTNITVGNKVGQTFQHVSGATITIDNTMSDPSDLPSQVTLNLGFGEKITVDAPSTNEYGIAGITSSLGNAGGGGSVKQLDKKVMQKQSTKTAAEINQQLDASEKASGAQTAKVGDISGQENFEIEDTVENVAKTLGDRIKNILRGKTFDNFFPGGSKGRRFAAEVKTFLGYLTGINKQPITNDSISKSHLQSLFRDAKLTTDNSGRVQMSDFIVGSGQKLVFTPNDPYNFGSSLDVSLQFTYDFNDNATELLKRDVDWWTRFTSDLVGSKHGYDSNALYGKMIDLAKASGRGQAVAGKFNISMNELFKLNPDLIRKHMEFNLVGKYFAEPWTVDMMRQSMFKPVNQIPSIKAGVHAYYALTGQLPPQSVAIGSKEYQEMQLGKYNFGDHPEYDPEVIANIDKLRKVAKSNAAFGKVGGGNAGSYVPSTNSDVFDRDDVSFKKKDYEKNRRRGYSRLKVTDPNRPARRVDPSKIVGRGFRIPRGTPRSQIVGRIREGLFEKLKDRKIIKEGMTTSNAFTVILPSRGETDLQSFETGLTGDGGIDFGQSGVNDSTMTGDGEYTGLAMMGDITTVEDPTGVGPWFRHRDFDFGDNPSKQSIHGGTYASSSAIGVGAIENQMPGYVPASFRGVRTSGSYGGSPDYINRHGHTIDQLGLKSAVYSNVEGLTRKGYGTALEFPDGAWMATKDLDTSEMDTLKIHARVSNSNISNASDQTEVYYWAGNKPGFKSVSGDTIYAGGEGIGQNKPNDGWRPLNQKPDGSFDNSVSTVLIGPNKQPNPDNVLQSHSVHIPEWARGKNSRFIIFSKGTLSNGTFSMTSIRFQRKNTMSIQVPLGDPEGSNFIRGGIIDGKTTTPEERKKRVAEMLKTSSQYVTGKFGKGFPGQPTVTAGDSTFDTKRFNEEVSIEEQISFPQMQQRIRDAKEKRREQQKKSEKLYIDTKKKGVKFYDKKGSGRLKDGKKIYD